MSGRMRRVLGYVAAVAFMLLAWQLASMALASPALPPPAAAFREFFVQFPVLLPHLVVSTARVLASILLGLAIGAPLGLLIGRGTRLNVFFDPLISINYPIPKVVFLPVLFVLLGIYDVSKVTLITLIVAFQILVTARDAARSIPPGSVLSVRSLGADRGQVFRHVVVPAAMPEIFTALRIGSGTAVAVLFIAESVAGSTGLGYYVFDAWGRVAYAEMFAGIIAMALLGAAVYEAIGLVEGRVCRWTRAGRTV